MRKGGGKKFLGAEIGLYRDNWSLQERSIREFRQRILGSKNVMNAESLVSWRCTLQPRKPFPQLFFIVGLASIPFWYFVIVMQGTPPRFAAWAAGFTLMIYLVAVGVGRHIAANRGKSPRG